MKRVICLVVALISVFSFSAIADDLNFASYDTQKLIDLELKIQNEIAKRGADCDFIMYSGKYVVGEDLEPGDYIFQCASVFPNEAYTKVRKYSVNDGNFSDVLDDAYLENEETYRFKLVEGNGIEIEDGMVTCLKMK